MATAWKTAWVTGASSGIGRELALKLADRGVKVAVSARSADKLDELSRINSNITPIPLDVTSREAVNDAVANLVDKFGHLDLVVLNAGVWQPIAATKFDAGAASNSMAVNYLGVANVLEPLIPRMVARGQGQLALVASVAGYRGLPKAAVYAPTKAAVISLAEVLRVELAPHGVEVSLVNPGFVETPMTAVNEFPMPFILKPDDAAERIIRGLAKGKFEVAFPWQLVTIMKLLRVMPNALFLKLAGRL